MFVTSLLLSLCVTTTSLGADWGDLRLPWEHVPYYFRNEPHVREECHDDVSCPYKTVLGEERCWGYEDPCPEEQRMGMPHCVVDARQQTRSRENLTENNRQKFWRQADFGYVKRLKLEYKTYCAPEVESDSYLDCVDDLLYCRARNIVIDLATAKIHSDGYRYRDNLLTEGQIGGRCQLDKESLKAQNRSKRPLSSWFAEVEHFASLPYHPVDEGHCDVVFHKPTFLIKPDAGGNMYHHFCDFLNLYISQHFNHNFSTDINILVWDTSYYNYGDPFSLTWKAFTDHRVTFLREYDGKRMCFRDATFSFLARMAGGLFYNTPMVQGCRGSSMVRAFAQHTLHRLDIGQDGPLVDKVRVTLLSRSTSHRRILNEDEIIRTLKSLPDVELTVVDFKYKSVSFNDQLKISHNSDVFMGIHGAGLTHLLFQPDWGALFEIYNCEDWRCYLDLTRMRGLAYFTWEAPDKVVMEALQEETIRPKFANYTFEAEEFLRLVRKAVEHVKSHPGFLSARAQKYGTETESKDEL